MKIAYIQRGQARNTTAASRIFQKYTVDAYPQHVHSVHIYTWNHTSRVNEGGVSNLTFGNSMSLKTELMRLYDIDDTQVTIGDNSHYRDIILPFVKYADNSWDPLNVYTALNQIIADMRAQEQLLSYCNLHDYTPDLIVDTRPEMMHLIENNFYENSVATLKANPNSILAHKLREWDSYRYVGDYTFVYNMETLTNMCTQNSTTRLLDTLYSEPNLLMMNPNTRKGAGKTYWMSHTLYPTVVHKLQSYIKMNIDDTHPTVILDSQLEHEIFNKPANNNIYYAYCDLQSNTGTTSLTNIERERIHNTLLNNA